MGAAGLVERRGDGGALRREACPAGAGRPGTERGVGPCEPGVPRAGTARPLGEGSEGRTGSPGKERRGGTRLPSGVSGTGTQPGELPLSAGRLREEPRPLRPSNQGAPARPERKALWDGGGKRGGRRVAEATGGVAAGRTGPDRTGAGRDRRAARGREAEGGRGELG